MSAPISIDLRQRIVDAWRARQVPLDTIARQFQVGSATVKRLIRDYRQTGSVAPRPHGGGRPPLISDAKLERVQRLVEQHPDWTSQELTVAYARQFDEAVSIATMQRALVRLGFSRGRRPAARPADAWKHALHAPAAEL
ncbi:transposase [Myxococcus faecalis]|uniref:helix-turn-helix domain-containing protein n=1 Tax=Myxococcus faecalis TaxID=3115646 RepID=UPI003CF80ACC